MPSNTNRGLVLRSGSERITIHFVHYEDEECERIIAHVRSILRPEVQTDWNLFVYKAAIIKERAARTKPEPGEILIQRRRCDRVLLPSLVVMSLVGVVTWRYTGRPYVLFAPLIPLAAWALVRTVTPAKGMIISRPTSGDYRFVWFMLLWLLIALTGLRLIGKFQSRLTHPSTVLIFGMIIWVESYASKRVRKTSGVLGGSEKPLTWPRKPVAKSRPIRGWPNDDS